MQNKNDEEDVAAPVDGVIKSIRSLEIYEYDTVSLFLGRTVSVRQNRTDIEKYVVLLSWCMNQ